MRANSKNSNNHSNDLVFPKVEIDNHLKLEGIVTIVASCPPVQLRQRYQSNRKTTNFDRPQGLE